MSQSNGATNAQYGHRRGPFRIGERVQITDERRRVHTLTLEKGRQFHSHVGVLDHDAIIGGQEGSVVENSNGVRYQCLRPLLKDFVLSMPRGAAVVYPKDAGQIVTMGDIYPGSRVVEAGVGSGALSISLLRAVGERGTLHSFERREDFADVARGNVATMFGELPSNWCVTLGDFQEQVLNECQPGSVDRVVLDMLAPWECLEAVATVLAPGGVWVNYVATVTQLSRVVEAIRADGRFTEPESFESMVRGWHIDGLAVRPDHRMVAHTGFLMTVRRLADGAVGIPGAKRVKEASYSAEDLSAWTADHAEEAWTPEGLGERGLSVKKLRKAGREALRTAVAGGAELQGELDEAMRRSDPTLQPGRPPRESVAGSAGDATAHEAPVEAAEGERA